MSNKQEELKQILLSGPLQEVNFYNVNPIFFELIEEGFWIIDAGIELKFPAGTFSAAWHSDIESFVFQNDTVNNIYSQNNLVQLQSENMTNMNQFVGLNVIQVDFKNKEFQFIMDYTMIPKGQDRLVELILEFENKSKLQIAFIEYTCAENEVPTNFSFNIYSELLISTKEIMPIKNEN